MKYIKPENYILIQGWMLELGCSNWNELAAFALVYGFSQDSQSEFRGSISYIQEWLGCSRHTAINTMRALEEKGLIIKKQTTISGVSFNHYQSVIITKSSSAKITPPMQNGSAATALGSAKIAPNNNIDNNKDNNTPISISTPYVVDTLMSPKGEGRESYATTEVSHEELLFDDFRRAYRGTKRGLATEFANFKKKHSDWKQVVSILKSSYEHQCFLKDEARQRGCFVAQEKNLQTYINQRCWEEEPQFSEPQQAQQRQETVLDKMRAADEMYRTIKNLRHG